MTNVNISEFRANLLKYLEQANSGDTINVTSNGRLLATVSAPTEQKLLAQQQLEQLGKTAKIYDVVGPTGVEWEVNL